MNLGLATEFTEELREEKEGVKTFSALKPCKFSFFLSEFLCELCGLIFIVRSVARKPCLVR